MGWLKFSGNLEEGRVSKAAQIREYVREMVAFGLTLKNRTEQDAADLPHKSPVKT